MRFIIRGELIWRRVACCGVLGHRRAGTRGTGVREHGIRDRGTIYVCYVGAKYIIVINNLRPGLVRAECSYYSVLYYYCIIL
jgi:hypothetical protein